VTHEAVPWDLRGWGEIAAALGVSVVTARRWERGTPPLPVSRFRGSVVAVKYELTKWSEAQLEGPVEPAETPDPVVQNVWGDFVGGDERE